eukprot:TRINITY_DN1286_c0_g1_i1.p2 TRINITY_DN1286_c0_g1~~TRINITY_DN1286_c0_g1_i1.p2  ORF type:complete len:186 (-),score=22.45 TRINITY_DN1286_c0_g1_i1:174-686(-)
MAAMKSALVATLVLAMVAACAASNLFVRFEDQDNVKVFQALEKDPKQIAGFGDGTVFDYPVTLGYSKVVARLQGLFYASSNYAAISSYQETFTLLFLDAKTLKYSGTSFTFVGVFVDGFSLEFPIVGGTGALTGLKGTAILLVTKEDNLYQIVVKESSGKKYKKYWASLY